MVALTVPGVQSGRAITLDEAVEELHIDFEGVEEQQKQWCIRVLQAAIWCDHPVTVPVEYYINILDMWTRGERIPVPRNEAKCLILEAHGGNTDTALKQWLGTVPPQSQGAATISAQNTIRMCMEASKWQ